MSCEHATPSGQQKVLPKMPDAEACDRFVFETKENLKHERRMFEEFISDDLYSRHPSDVVLHYNTLPKQHKKRSFYDHGPFKTINLQVSPNTPAAANKETVQRKITASSKTIWEEFSRLQMIVGRHEATIRRRWKSIQRPMRLEMLQLAWGGNMVTEHRFDMEHLIRGCSGIGSEAFIIPHKEQNGLWWPNFNDTDMCMELPLLYLLNARGRYPPWEFVMIDLLPTIHNFRHSHTYQTIFLDRWNARFARQNDPLLYGKLVSWGEDPNAFERLQYRRDLCPAEGDHMTHIQEVIYVFLVRMCEQILEGISLKESDLLKTPIQPEPAFPLANYPHDDDTTAALMTFIYKEAYHYPEKPDFRRLQRTVASKRSEAEDRIWGMWEDPTIFTSALQEYMGHGPETLPSSEGNRDSDLAQGTHSEAMVEDSIKWMLSYHLPATEAWGIIHDKIEEFADLKEKLFDGGKIKPDEDLPREMALSLLRLYFFVRSRVEWAMEEIEADVRMSPPVRRLLQRLLGPQPEKGEIRKLTTSKWEAMISPLERKYLSVVKMASDPEFRWIFGVPDTVSELERLTREEECRELVSNRAARVLSDVFVMAECIRQIERFEPWAPTFYMAGINEIIFGKLMNDHWEVVRDFAPLRSLASSTSATQIGTRVTQMRYPVGEEHTKANVEAMRAAEQCLDQFWDQVIAEMQVFGIWRGRLAQFLTRVEPERTPNWVEPPSEVEENALAGEEGLAEEDELAGEEEEQVEEEEAAEEEALAETKLSTEDNSLNEQKEQPLGGKSTRPSKRTDRRVFKEPKIKTKRRGVPNPPEPAESNAAPENQANELRNPEPLFAVDSASMQVFSTLFYRPGAAASQQPAQIPWGKFMHAMHQVGFSIQRLGGSIWQFNPGPILEQRGPEYGRGILIHEPHPTSKIPYHMARDIGKRFTKIYGWNVDTFEQRK